MLPEKITLPLSKITLKSKLNASSKYELDQITLVFLLIDFLTKSNNSSLDNGSTPTDGSSKIKSSGLLIKARAINTF